MAQEVAPDGMAALLPEQPELEPTMGMVVVVGISTARATWYGYGAGGACKAEVKDLLISADRDPEANELDTVAVEDVAVFVRPPRAGLRNSAAAEVVESELCSPASAGGS